MRQPKQAFALKGWRTPTAIAILALLILPLLATGCAPAEDAATPDEEMVGDVPEQELAEEAGPEADPAERPAEAMVIREGQAHYEVRDVDAAVEAIENAARAHQAEIMDSSRRERDGHRSAEFEFRVEADRFHEFMEELEDIEGAVNIGTSAEDVTEEAMDLEARLEVLQAQEERLTALLEEAANVEEMLMIEEELARVRSDIESKQGRLDYLEDRVQYSRVTVHVTQREETVVGEGPAWTDFPQALADGWETWSTRATSLALGLVRAWPPVLVLAIVAVLGYRYRKLRRERPNQANRANANNEGQDTK